MTIDNSDKISIRPTFASAKTKRLLTSTVTLFTSILTAIFIAVTSTNAIAQETKQKIGLESRKKSTQTELRNIENKIQISAARKIELSDEIKGLEKDRATINRNLIQTSTRSRRLEESIARSAKRLNTLRTDEAGVRAILKSKRGVLIEVIAALQRMGHKPPPALLVRPEDALSSVRSAILLGAVVPEVREETQKLVGQLKKLVAIKNDIDENRATLKSDLENLAEEETRLTLLLEQKKRHSINARQNLAKQTALAAELAGKATNLNNLIEQLELNIDSARKAAIAARAEEERRKNLEKLNIAKKDVKQPDFSDTGRIAPAMAFSAAKGLLPKPVSGVEIASFGKKNAEGEVSKSIGIATKSNARVQSPADGWVIFAGPFRSYGNLLILNAGDGYRILLSGMDTLNVELGQFILTGEPIGKMAESRIASTSNVEVGFSKPVLYIEFRKEDLSIDPSPWWTRSNLEERNG